MRRYGGELAAPPVGHPRPDPFGPGGLLALACDLHNHLLPDVDDGSRSLDETLRHLQMFCAQGVAAVCFTPHLLAATRSPEQLAADVALHRERFTCVQGAVGEKDGFPRLHLGQEILAPGPEDLRRALQIEGVGVDGGQTVLVELGFRPGFDGAAVVAAGRADGRRVILAHPERYAYGDTDPLAAMEEWRGLGASLQVNGGSLLGHHGRGAQDLGTTLCREGIADLVATDHHGEFRPHMPEEILAALEEILPAQAVRDLLVEGPGRVLAVRTP